MEFKSLHLNEIIIMFNRSPFYLAVERENIEIIKLLLTNDKLDVNYLYILFYLFLRFVIMLFNSIIKHLIR